jgi:site-specific recombinase XerD
VTHLKKMMLEELQLRNYAQNTIRHYLRAVEDFARHFNCSPDRLGPRHIREYQAELFEKRKLSANSVGQHLAALRFFYIKTLRKAWSIAETPYPKKTRRLPTILSREEVAQLLHAARTPGERILLMTLYATGARNSELTHLKVNDIDSQRMVVHIRGGTDTHGTGGLWSSRQRNPSMNWLGQGRGVAKVGHKWGNFGLCCCG